MVKYICNLIGYFSFNLALYANIISLKALSIHFIFEYNSKHSTHEDLCPQRNKPILLKYGEHEKCFLENTIDVPIIH